MIPKIVHYIWFGGKPFPPKIQKCIDSWQKYLPDYKFMLWNESTFDVEICPFTKQAFQLNKWAFVSDYVRIWALYKYGGWYFDTDIEILKPLYEFEDKRMVLGTDHNGELTALMGSEVGHTFWQQVLDKYHSMKFINDDGTLNTVVNNTHIQGILYDYGYKHENLYQELKEGIFVFPAEYFHVADLEKGTIHRTENSFAIHWHTLLWTSDMSHWMRFFRIHVLKPIFGEENFMGVWNKMTKFFK